MGYSVWDSMWGFGHHRGKKKDKEEEAVDEYRVECVCRVVEAEDEEDDRKKRKKHGCGCPACQRSHGYYC